MQEPTWANVVHPKIDFQDLYYYSAPKSTEGPKSLDEVDPELLDTYAKLGIPLKEQEVLAGVKGAPRVAVDAVFDSVSVVTTFKEELAKAGVIFCSISEAVKIASGAGAQISRLGRADHRQFLCDAQLGGLLRRLVRLRAGGRALPDGALDLFPHQCRADRPVRAHADHRRQGRLRELSRRLHGADARREPAACRRGRADRARRCRDQVLDGAELVSRATRKAKAASTISSPSAATAGATAPRSPGRRSRPAPPSPGNTRAASCAATAARASSTRSPFPTATSRSIPAPR